MDGRKYFFSGFPMCKTGPQEMIGGTDIISIGEQRSASRSAMQVHLLFNSHAKVLHNMEPVRDLHRLRSALTGGLRIKAATIPADHLHLRMTA